MWFQEAELFHRVMAKIRNHEAVDSLFQRSNCVIYKIKSDLCQDESEIEEECENSKQRKGRGTEILE